jgi:hypothetical protein
MADIDKLAAELANDPLGRGYSTMTDQQAADDLNTAYRTRNVGSFSGDFMFQQTEPSEFTALTDHQQQLWMAFTSKASVDPWAQANVDFVTNLFGGGSNTVTALSDARTESITRAEELGILGNSDEIGPGHIQRARAQ